MGRFVDALDNKVSFKCQNSCTYITFWPSRDTNCAVKTIVSFYFLLSTMFLDNWVIGYVGSRFLCCVLLALSWNTANKKPNTDK